MKKWFVIIFLVAVAAGAYFLPKLYTQWQWSEDNEVSVFLLYNKKNLESAPFIAEAYKSVLQEEGVPFRLVEAEQIINLDAQVLAGRIPALVLPEYIMQVAPDGLEDWLEDYLQAGGNVAIIYDAATHNERGRFLKTAALADIIGFNYIMANEATAKPYENASIEFVSEKALDFFEITPGKAVRGTTLGNVGVDEAKYQVALSVPVKEIRKEDIFAYAITDTQEKVPAIILSNFGKGKVFYVNLALGFLKANADDLLLRSLLRAFLFEVVKMPHFINTQDGIGTVVINWSIYLRMEDKNLYDKIADGYFAKDIKASIHIAAGDYLHSPGDNIGFDALGRGYNQTRVLSRYGNIGSLGGWANNWFIKQIEQGALTKKELGEYIQKNNQALEKITGYKIREYSAPGGLHSQPMMTGIIEELGMNSYSYYGDFGSAPNRTFVGRKKMSDKVIAFPIASYGKFSNLWEYQEFYADTDETIDGWLQDLVRFVEDKKSVRTFAMNEHDIFYFPKSLSGFMQYLSTQQKEGLLAVVPMSDYADFFNRFLATQYTFTKKGNILSIDYQNPQNLEGIVLALPKQRYTKPEDATLEVKEDENYYYIKVLDGKEKTKNISVAVN